MTDIRFYHVTRQSLDQAVLSIVGKAFAQGKRILVLCSTKKDVAMYDDLLWTAKPDSFLPHGSEGDAYDSAHPIFISTKPDNPAKADTLALCDIVTPPDTIGDFSIVCDFIDGLRNESVAAGRVRWKAYKEAGHSVTYWQQSDQGAWEQKA